MLRHHRRIALAALVAAGAVTPLTLPATATAAPAKYADDLNGDRRADLSVGADGENAGDGAYWVLRGSSAGVTTTKAVSFGPSSAGMSTSGYPRLGATMLK